MGQTENRYRVFFNQTFQLVAVLKPSGLVEEVNETMRGIGMLEEEDVAGVFVWALPLWNEEARERLECGVASARSGNFCRDELHVRRWGGEDMIVDLSLKPIRNRRGDVYLIILEGRDITQHKHAQALLMQTQKMDILGQFASGIAHDFNNLLTVISGNLELMERRPRNDKVVAQRMAKVANAVQQARELTDRILAFMRKEELEPRPFSVAPVIVEAIELSKIGLRENTTIQSEIAPDLWQCWADQSQLQTALLNLLLNARDAMPSGGRITVRAFNLAIGPVPRDGLPELPEGDYVQLSVTDEGKGIPPDLVEKVTGPFFTTKEPGRGSGLGLSIVQAFVRQSEGDLVIASREGVGTSVSIYLPRSPDSAENGFHESAGDGSRAAVPDRNPA